MRHSLFSYRKEKKKQTDTMAIFMAPICLAAVPAKVDVVVPTVAVGFSAVQPSLLLLRKVFQAVLKLWGKVIRF